MRRWLLVAWLVFALAPRGTSSAAPPGALEPIVGQVIWVDFWASWCAPCRRSFPWMNEMHRKYADRGLQIVGVNVDKERMLAEAFLAETPAAFGLRFDPVGSLAAEFGVQAMPSSFLLDASGKVLARHFGFKLADTARYEAAIVDALAAASSRP